MEIFFKQIITLIILWILRMIEGIFEIFNNILCINCINDNNKKVNINDALINDNSVSSIFWIIFIITIILCLVFAIVSIIKNMVSNNKSIGSIIGKYVISIISTFIVLMIVMIIIMIANSFLILLMDLLSIDLNVNISSYILNLSVEEWNNSYSINEVDFSKITITQFLGQYEYKSYLIFPEQWKYNGMINPDKFMYLPCLVTSLIVLSCLVITIIIIVKRIYNIVLLYITMPLSLSTVALDDGERFKIWRDEFIKTIILSYMIFFAINIFNIMIPFIFNISFQGNISSYGQSLLQLFMVSGGTVFIISSINILNKIITPNNTLGFKKIIKYSKKLIGGH